MSDDLIGAGDGRAVRKTDNSEVNSKHLQAFIERIERLEEEKRAIADDIKDIYAEAKGTGYDAKIMRKIVAKRRLDAEKRRQEDYIFDLYWDALGLLD
jgi:uncharacterized protein (UPF0335 family)